MNAALVSLGTQHAMLSLLFLHTDVAPDLSPVTERRGRRACEMRCALRDETDLHIICCCCGLTVMVIDHEEKTACGGLSHGNINNAGQIHFIFIFDALEKQCPYTNIIFLQKNLMGIGYYCISKQMLRQFIVR